MSAFGLPDVPDAFERYEGLRATGMDAESAMGLTCGRNAVHDGLPYITDCPCPHGGEPDGCWECWREDEALDALEDEQLGLNRRLRYRVDPE